MRQRIRPPRIREALLGALIFAALVLGAWMDQGTTISDSASMLASDTATPTAATVTSQSADEVDGVTYHENNGTRGANNVVRLVNKQDGRLRVKSNVELNTIPSGTVEPHNVAFAYASCADCQTLTVALQINLISRSAQVVTPENVALALNYECTNCKTYAWALQYVISVDDPTVVPKDVSDLVKAMDRELQSIHSDRTVTLEQAQTRIRSVMAQFQELGASLTEQNSEQTDTTSPGATSQP